MLRSAIFILYFGLVALEELTFHQNCYIPRFCWKIKTIWKTQLKQNQNVYLSPKYIIYLSVTITVSYNIFWNFNNYMISTIWIMLIKLVLWRIDALASKLLFVYYFKEKEDIILHIRLGYLPFSPVLENLILSPLVLDAPRALNDDGKIYERLLQSDDVIGTFMNECVN